MAVTRTLAMTIAILAASIGAAPSAWAAIPYFTPHPAVVRVVAPESDGASWGSGALVEVNDSFGLVVTNWHVVRDATGPLMVYFPSGFRSGATVLKTDRDWDLAALAVWRPNVTPLPVSNVAPQPGDLLTIAGYGSGLYRAEAGRCTHYLSPGGNLPNEIVELDAPTRNGDSGGPILNERGELAGVLFGSAFGRTAGSYCGRLRLFLGTVEGDFQRISPQGPMVARQQKPTEKPLAAIAAANQNMVAIPAKDTTPAATSIATNCATKSTSSASAVASSSNPAPTAAMSPGHAAAPPPSPLPATESIKTVLAAIGVIALIYVALRLLGSAVG
jgi:hypothetical protein